MKKKDISTYLGQKIYFDDMRDVFFAKVGDEEFFAEKLSGLREKIKDSIDTKLDIDAIYASSGEFHKVKVVRVIDGLRDVRVVLDSIRLGIGVPDITDPSKVYPLTKKNIELMKKHKKVRDKGWELIHQADSMVSNLEPFERKYFMNLLAKKIKRS